jgi:hypothetical protein
MLTSHHQNAGHTHNRDNKSFKNTAKFKYLEIAATCQKYINEEIQSLLITTKFRIFVFLYHTIPESVKVKI